MVLNACGILFGLGMLLTSLNVTSLRDSYTAQLHLLWYFAIHQVK